MEVGHVAHAAILTDGLRTRSRLQGVSTSGLAPKASRWSELLFDNHLSTWITVGPLRLRSGQASTHPDAASGLLGINGGLEPTFVVSSDRSRPDSIVGHARPRSGIATLVAKPVNGTGKGGFEPRPYVQVGRARRWLKGYEQDSYTIFKSKARFGAAQCKLWPNSSGEGLGVGWSRVQPTAIQGGVGSTWDHPSPDPSLRSGRQSVASSCAKPTQGDRS